MHAGGLSTAKLFEDTEVRASPCRSTVVTRNEPVGVFSGMLKKKVAVSPGEIATKLHTLLLFHSETQLSPSRRSSGLPQSICRISATVLPVLVTSTVPYQPV